MAYNRFTRILPVALILIIAVIAIAALISLARVIFFPGSSNETAVIDTSRESLLSTSVEHKVRMTVRGPIVADEAFRSYQITVSSSSRELATYKGYLDSGLDKISLSNNVQAYDEFVHALDKANLAKGDAFEGDRNDLRGVCATGRVTNFEIIEGDSVVKSLWTSTCNGSKGSLDANVDQLSDLFVAQIPDAQDTIRNVAR
jgi:hypothetical protein